MPTQKVEIEFEVPDGYRATGGFRRPKAGEIFLGIHGQPFKAIRACGVARKFILEKIEPEIRTGYINVYADGVDYIHATKQNADSVAYTCPRIACVEVKYEVPVQ